MKILLTMNEIIWIVEAELLRLGLKVQTNSGAMTTHTVGQFADQQTIFDVMSFDVDSPDDRICPKCGYRGPCFTCPKCVKKTETEGPLDLRRS